MRRRAPSWRAYAAEIGASGVLAALVVAAVGTAVELWRPGTFFTFIAPQHVAGAFVLFAALSIADDAPRPFGWGGLIAFAAVGAVIAVIAFRVAFGVFGGDLGIASATAFAALLPFVLFRRFGTDDHP